MPRRIIKPSPALRTAMFVVGDLLVWTAALYGAYYLRFDGDIPAAHLRRIPFLLLIFIPPKLLAQYTFRLYRVTWHLIGLTDLVNVWKAATLGTLLASTLLVFLRSVPGFEVVPRSVILIDYGLSLGGIVLFRFSRRLWDFYRGGRRPRHSTRRVLLVGAGAAGERLARAMLDDPRKAHRPVGFIDDDPNKHGTYVHGLKVFGGRRAIAEVVRRLEADEIVIAIPSAPIHEIRGIVEQARQSDARSIRILPGVHELLSGKVVLQDIREVNLLDLLHRPPVNIEMDALARFLTGKRVMVTGAAGSIGSELVRQLTRFPCGEILALDCNESGLFELEETVQAYRLAQVPVRTVVADIRDRHKVDWVFRTMRPHVVYHAAAYKHVPLMERHAEEAVKTNVIGTLVLAEAAVRTGVEIFTLISTDKAVNPNNIMGATKRVAERIVQALSQRGRTRFFAVRFGNVLGSRGSLIPLIQEQIRRGGPITLTHPDMRRYFMSISEAVLLVLQASMADRQTGIFVLDMGEPVRVVDIATEMIRLSGLEPDKDIAFVFTGVRPGEKMEEALTESDEDLLPTRFQKVHEIRSNGLPDEIGLRLAVQELEHFSYSMDADGLRALLARLAIGGTEAVAGTAVRH